MGSSGIGAGVARGTRSCRRARRGKSPPRRSSARRAGGGGPRSAPPRAPRRSASGGAPGETYRVPARHAASVRILVGHRDQKARSPRQITRWHDRPPARARAGHAVASAGSPHGAPPARRTGARGRWTKRDTERTRDRAPTAGDHGARLGELRAPSLPRIAAPTAGVFNRRALVAGAEAACTGSAPYVASHQPWRVSSCCVKAAAHAVVRRGR